MATFTAAQAALRIDHRRGFKSLNPKRRFTAVKALKPENVYVLPNKHPAIIKKKTLFLKSLRNPNPFSNVFIAGKYQQKLGDRVSKGAWKGMAIYTLTLEERATCPSTCYMWSSCYGNGMPFSKRWRHGKTLELAMYTDLERLDERHPQGFVIRLHVLGDFYSLHYVSLWRSFLEEFPGLHIFGYSAHGGNNRIGRGLQNINRDFAGRFVIRHSSVDIRAMGSTVIGYIPEAGPIDGIGIVCPAETGKTQCCGTCGLCWNAAALDKCIVFVAHGNKPLGRPKKNDRIANPLHD